MLRFYILSYNPYHANVVAVEQDLFELGGFPSFRGVLTNIVDIKVVHGILRLVFCFRLLLVSCSMGISAYTYNSVTSSRTILT